MNALASVVIDSGRNEVWLAGKRARLTLQCFEIVALLWRRKGDVVRHRFFYLHFYGERPDCDVPQTSVIVQQVCRLNRALTPIGLHIEAVWGVGYRLTRIAPHKLSPATQRKLAA